MISNFMASAVRAAEPLVVRSRERDMTIPKQPSFSVTRQELEGSWLLKLQKAQARYEAATARYGRLLLEQPKGLNQKPDDSLPGIRQAASQSLAEYARVLGIFVDLTVHGKIPKELSAAGSHGV
jgi:hypothetical protein